MAFIRIKMVKGRPYSYLVENYREGGKVRQRVLKYLGAGDKRDSSSAAKLGTTPKTQPKISEKQLGKVENTHERDDTVRDELRKKNKDRKLLIFRGRSVSVTVIKETEKAILVKDEETGSKTWIPKSQIKSKEMKSGAIKETWITKEGFRITKWTD